MIGSEIIKDFICIHELTKSTVNEIFGLAERLKEETKKGKSHHILAGKTLGLIFSKSSTRTRVSFEVGMYQLGGHPIFLSSNDIQVGRGESIKDTAKVLSRYIDCIMIRTFENNDVKEFAKYSSIPVINGLTDLLHPCQVLADLFTLKEHKGKLEGLKLAYVGDGNNVANSLLYGCSKVGMDIAVATPEGYECDESVVYEALQDSKVSRSSVVITNDPVEAVKDVDVIYTDTWVSMGQEENKENKIRKFKPYQINRNLCVHAKKNAVFLHCLPAYRGLEVTEEVIDGKNSLVYDEAENRLHIQKAIMVLLMG